MIQPLPGSAAPERDLERAGLRPSRWSAGPGARFDRHRHDRTKRLFVLRGSIRFDGVSLSAGQAIRIPAGHEHSAVAGDAGVECVEGFEPA